MSEEEKLKAGLWHDANNDENLLKMRLEAQDTCFLLNQTRPRDIEKKQGYIEELLGYQPEDFELISPFICDYGKHIKIGKNCFINSQCYFMDGASITLGNNVFIGPYCGLYTVNHPLDKEKRNQGLEKALPIIIEDNVWLGANVTVLQGVTIGEGSVIGAGSIVTQSIPKKSLAYGNPCKVVQTIEL